jgi:GTP diphosphokinase / guanosine-3',5'-bis(diphosphate) 3'-diphosphatase
MALQHLDRFSPEERMHMQKALEFATKAHASQKRRGGGLYIAHPIATAQLLIDEFNADADTVITGLLHDTVEDTEARLEDIEQNFGPVVRFLVDGVTDYGQHDGNEHIPDKLVRADKSAEKALQYAAQDKRLLLVKIADRWDNMKTVEVHTPRGQVGYSRATLQFHVAHCRKLGFPKQAAEIERLCMTTIARWPQYQ